ncbi:MAG: hypothetical protein ACLQDV_25590 [Candidatus Binataceae bacterium]
MPKRIPGSIEVPGNTSTHAASYEGNLPENQRCAVFFPDRVRMVRRRGNAATSLIVEGVNGFVAASLDPPELAAQIVKVHRGGAGLLSRSHQWFREHAHQVSIEASIASIEQAHRTIARQADPPHD